MLRVPDALDSHPLVYVVDDDQGVCDTMRCLLDTVGMRSQIFQAASQFVAQYDPNELSCLVLDIRLPGISGLELQEQLVDKGIELPIIFITGYGDVKMAVQAIRNGAFDFIEKPFGDQRLLDSISAALIVSQSRKDEAARRKALIDRWQSLTRREKQVANLIVTGKPNKVIAFDLGVSQRTVEIHRGHLMRKMDAQSLADLVRMRVEIDEIMGSDKNSK